MSNMRIQDTIGSKVDIDRREMDILALVFCSSSSFDGIDLAGSQLRIDRDTMGTSPPS